MCLLYFILFAIEKLVAKPINLKRGDSIVIRYNSTKLNKKVATSQPGDVANINFNDKNNQNPLLNNIVDNDLFVDQNYLPDLVNSKKNNNNLQFNDEENVELEEDVKVGDGVEDEDAKETWRTRLKGVYGHNRWVFNTIFVVFCLWVAIKLYIFRVHMIFVRGCRWLLKKVLRKNDRKIYNFKMPKKYYEGDVQEEDENLKEEEDVEVVIG
ncbi:hypothetical protein BDAP_002230 [Binucleata daphniae]